MVIFLWPKHEISYIYKFYITKLLMEGSSFFFGFHDFAFKAVFDRFLKNFGKRPKRVKSSEM